MINIHGKILEDYDGSKDSFYWKMYKLGIMAKWDACDKNNEWWELNEDIKYLIRHYERLIAQ